DPNSLNSSDKQTRINGVYYTP
uniref:Uncharacterized protein n=1 Tax=Amphimedon queenslandica TaxID=400682 RepID=A0A1X7UPX3_AMPQE